MPEEKKVIKIKCKGTKDLPINELLNFQGNLKTLPKENEEKLRQSILKYGFRIPVFVWQKNIMDGHQRIFVLNKMIKDGYIIDPLPIIEIQAKDKKEAKEILLLINSRYGVVTDAGLTNFLKGISINDLKILDIIDVPNIDLSVIKADLTNNISGDILPDEQMIDEKLETHFRCPKCGYKWS